LVGAAGQILWEPEGKATRTAEGIIRLLRNRFGNSNQAERFRAELRTRRRGPGESLQQLYMDVCHLISLAYPGTMNNVTKIVARDSFLEALGNNDFRVRILEKEPPDLDTALNYAVRLEAFDAGCTNADQHRGSLDRSQRQKEHYSRVVTEEDYKTSSWTPEKLLDTTMEERFFKCMGDSVQGYMKQFTDDFRKKWESEDYSRQKGGGKKRNSSRRLIETKEQQPTIKAIVQVAVVQHPTRQDLRTSLQETRLRLVRLQTSNGKTKELVTTVVKQVTGVVRVHTGTRTGARKLLVDPVVKIHHIHHNRVSPEFSSLIAIPEKGLRILLSNGVEKSTRLCWIWAVKCPSWGEDFFRRTSS